MIRGMVGLEIQTDAITVHTGHTIHPINLLTVNQASITALPTVQYPTARAMTATMKLATVRIPISQDTGRIIGHQIPTGVAGMAMVHLQIVIGTKVGQGLGAIPLAETISAEIIMTAEWIQRGNTAVCARPHLTLNFLRDLNREVIRLGRISIQQQAMTRCRDRDCLVQARIQLKNTTRQGFHPKTTRYHIQGNTDGHKHRRTLLNPRARNR